MQNIGEPWHLRIYIEPSASQSPPSQLSRDQETLKNSSSELKYLPLQKKETEEICIAWRGVQNNALHVFIFKRKKYKNPQKKHMENQ